MNYAQFVTDVHHLLEEGRTLFGKNETHLDPNFRKWRHKLTATLNAIEDRGYSIDCDVRSRHFDIAAYGDFSKKERIEIYDQELQDTLNELETITTQFKKYGDPKSGSASKPRGREKNELESPQKITLSWLWRHVPITLWIGFVGLLVTIFLLGVATGQSRLYAEIEALWKPVAAAGTTAPNKALEPTP